jgi:hypothetical protein
MEQSLPGSGRTRYRPSSTRERQHDRDSSAAITSGPPFRPRSTDAVPCCRLRAKLRRLIGMDARILWRHRGPSSVPTSILTQDGLAEPPSGSGSAIFRSSTRRLRDEWFEQVETSPEEWEEKGPMGEGESACKVRHNNARHAGKNWDETCPCDAPAISPKSQRPVIHNQSESYS